MENKATSFEELKAIGTSISDLNDVKSSLFKGIGELRSGFTTLEEITQLGVLGEFKELGDGFITVKSLDDK